MMKLPQKSHFKMDETCGLTGVKPYVLRFWESEFDEISPVSSSSGQKLYSYDDLEKILLIKRFLFQDKLTIEQARAKLLLANTQESDHSERDEESRVPKTDQLDLESLVMAKKQLESVLQVTQSLKDRHNWV